MLIVGLGNPGSDYENTRHNIGFMVVDELNRRLSSLDVSKTAFLGKTYKSKNHFLLKPQTFMNLSGDSVVKVKNFYKIEDVVVIHDDLDLPFGSLRFKKGGGHGGHNGLKSIDANITKEYIRVRMGIGKPEHKGEVISYVLGEFTVEQKEYLDEFIAKACDSLMYLFEHTMQETSAKFSQKEQAKQTL